MKRPRPKETPTPPAGPVELGAVAAAHGLKGLLRVKPFTQTPEGLAAYGPVWVVDRDGVAHGWRRIAVTGVNKGVALCALEGIDGRDAADRLKGATLSVDRSALPEAEEGEFYQADLVGLRAVDTDGAEIGTVRAVQDFGAGDMLDIQPAAGPSILVPFVAAFVPEVDVTRGFLAIDADFVASLLAPVERSEEAEAAADRPEGMP